MIRLYYLAFKCENWKDWKVKVPYHDYHLFLINLKLFYLNSKLAGLKPLSSIIYQLLG